MAFAATESDPLIGLTLSGYVVKGTLGAGGMGTVYLCEHPDIGRRAAAKVLKTAVAGDSDWAARFVREARVMATLKQRNIVDIINFGAVPDGRSYVLMEFLDGESLRERLDRDGPLPIHVALQIAEQIFTGLGVAHDVGVVHRDLKPENTFLVAEPNGETLVKLIDFGLARIDDHAPDSTGQQGESRARIGSLYAGTPEYLSPEQALQQAVGPAADLYAVGVMLFEMVAGRLPFEGNIAQLLQQHASSIPPSLGDVADGVPEALTSLVRRLLDKQPDQRPRTAQLARQELVRIQKSMQAAGTQVRRVEQPSAQTKKFDEAPPRRRRAWWMLAPALIVVLAVVLASSQRNTAAVEPRTPIEPQRPSLPEPVAASPEPLRPLPVEAVASLPPIEPPAAAPAAPATRPPVRATKVKQPAGTSPACQELDSRREAMLQRIDGTKTALRARLAKQSQTVREAAMKGADEVRAKVKGASTPAACRQAVQAFDRWLESVE